MNKKHIAAHFEAHLGELLRHLPANERKAFKYCVADSYEQGAQDRTDGFGEIFKIRYGYDPKPFLPALSGRAVGTPEMTDRFLWDLRRFVAFSGCAYLVYKYNKSAKFRINIVRGPIVSLSGIFFDEKK